MNQIFIIGNLTADPELKAIGSGAEVCTFTVAVNRRKKKTNEDKPTFFYVQTWENLAISCANFLCKGSKVCVEGEILPNEPFISKNGSPYCKLVINAHTVEFLDRRKVYGQSSEASAEETEIKMEDLADVKNDDIPF